MGVSWHPFLATRADENLHNEQPTPSTDAVAALEGQASSSNETTESTSNHLKNEQNSISLAQLSLGVPGTEVVQNTGEEDSLSYQLA